MSTLPVTLPPALQKKLVSGQEVRYFSDSQLQAAVQHAFDTLPEDHHAAVVAHADLNGASLSIVARVGNSNNFTVVASGYRTWAGKLSAEAEIRYSI